MSKDLDPCVWIYVGDDDYGSWKTSCGEAFSLVSGTPTKHGIRYCPCCERTLKEVRENERRP
uniref:Uncharacterized protein n=1 Tax=viral metagenome TaxID=1070528 RepID=A0A6M3LGF5_9ZZZZ